MAMHSGSDTFHQFPGYNDMLQGEFKTHGAQVPADLVVADTAHPATAGLPNPWNLVQEEMYQFKNYDPAKVHELLVLDKKPEKPFSPGHFPVSWSKSYGQGRVFYTSLGHREDIIDADPGLKDRKNSPDVSKAYQAHVLGGIEWALGVKPAAAH